MKYILLVIEVLFIGLFLFIKTNHLVPKVVSSAAVFSSAVPQAGGFGQTINSGNIACNFSSSLVTNADGSQQAQLSWNVTPGTEVYIPELNNYVSYQANGTAITPVLDNASSYTIKVTTGDATSTCQTSATPTSFSSAQAQ